ncbi:MAG: glycoside hydrolase family 3 protein [Lachnospiraceae bacterium]|nr:glycoside hydrolase family 3 protein [Lachnospiraceae bacterium]
MRFMSESAIRRNFEKEKTTGYQLIDMEEMEYKLSSGAYDISAMTLREKILQMCVITTRELGDWNMTDAGENVRDMLAKYPVGGVIFFEDQLQDPEQTCKLLSQLQEYAEEIGLPKLFLCIDEEGGKVARIANNRSFGVENPGPMKNIETAEDALEAGRYIGKYLSSLGFNVDFAPDADVLTAPGSKIIGNRSFGDDPQKVTELAAAVSDGLHEYGILSCFKHFPGHGAVEADTHEGLAYTDKSLEDLMSCEIIPFAKAGELGIDMVMASHISVPAILGNNTPCSLSEYMLTTVLKEQLGYDGLVITDALNMGAVTKDLEAGEAAVMAVKAGVDILLMPPDLDAAVEAIEAAVKNGEIAEEWINESVEKILVKKRTLRPVSCKF